MEALFNMMSTNDEVKSSNFSSFTGVKKYFL